MVPEHEAASSPVGWIFVFSVLIIVAAQYSIYMLYWQHKKEMQGGLMSQKRIQQIEQRIDRIKKTLMEIGPMRPGSLSRQYKDPQHHTGAYWQISYTRRMKSRTEYVRPEWVKEIRRQTATHKRFKRLVDQWIDLSIEHSRLTMQMVESKG
jgi:hypothetical protein